MTLQAVCPHVSQPTHLYINVLYEPNSFYPVFLCGVQGCSWNRLALESPATIVNPHGLDKKHIQVRRRSENDSQCCVLCLSTAGFSMTIRQRSVSDNKKLIGLSQPIGRYKAIKSSVRVPTRSEKPHSCPNLTQGISNLSDLQHNQDVLH